MRLKVTELATPLQTVPDGKILISFIAFINVPTVIISSLKNSVSARLSL